MAAESPWRSLRSVMIVTMYVAVISYGIRISTRPSTGLGSSLIWAPVAIVTAGYLCWPMGKALALAFQPEVGPTSRRCPRCRADRLRPLLRSGGRIGDVAVGSRCLGCGVTFRVAAGVLVEEARAEPDPGASASDVLFLEDETTPGRPAGREIRFLDE